MSITNQDDVLKRARAVMARLGLAQKDLAETCGVSQGHLSKVLRGEVVLTKKMAERLQTWVTRSEGKSESDEEADMLRFVERLVRRSPERREQFMQLLKLIDEITR